MSKGIVISLYDFTGEALRPWADAGYECYAFDIQHTGNMEVFPDSGGIIHYEYADLHDTETLLALREEFMDKPVVFGMPFLSALIWRYQVRHTSNVRLNVTLTFKLRQYVTQYGVVGYLMG